MTNEVPEKKNPYKPPKSATMAKSEKSAEPFSLTTVFFACMFFGFLANIVGSIIPEALLPRLHVLETLRLSAFIKAWTRLLLPGISGLITYQFLFRKSLSSEKTDYAVVIIAMLTGFFLG